MYTLTKEIRDALTPQKAVQILKDGNARFVNNLKINRNLFTQVNETSGAQHPFAFILSCIDSRTSAELIFDQGLGDIFSCRIAGNILNEDIVGSMEFACKVAGAKLIMALGHSECGAIKGACAGVEMGSLTGLLNKIKPAIEEVKSNNSGEGNFIEKVAEMNVEQVSKEILVRSSIIRDMLNNNEITIVSGIYSVSTGEVNFY